MLKRLFGNYLVEKKIITQEQLNSLLPVPKDATAEVETIATILKMMPASAVKEILAAIDKNTSRFGDIAIEKGYLSDDRLDTILTYQSNAFMSFCQVLLNKRILQIEHINPLLDEYQQKGGFTELQMSALIHDDFEQCVDIFVPLKSAELKMLALTLIQTLRRLIDEDVYLEKAYLARSFQLDKYACQAIVGDMHLRIYLSAPEDGLLGIANYFSGDTYEVVDNDALDNIGEFINCVSGLFATNLSYENVSVDMNSPEYSSLAGPYLSNEKLYVIPINANGDSFKAVFEVYE